MNDLIARLENGDFLRRAGGEKETV